MSGEAVHLIARTVDDPSLDPSLGSLPVVPHAEQQVDTRRRLRTEYAAVGYLVLAVTALIVVRAIVDAFDFIGVGWILVLATLPLLPWLIPRLGSFLKAISPYVESLKLGALQIDLQDVRREPISVPSSGIFATVANDVAALSSGTAIKDIVDALRDFWSKGAGPVVVIDLRDGRKWRLPNLYFLTRLLDIEPLVTELLFTEARGGSDGYLVGTCRPEDLRLAIERNVPEYSAASSGIQTVAPKDLEDPVRAQELGSSFTRFLQALGPPQPTADHDAIHGWVTAERIRTVLAGLLSSGAVESVGGTLRDEEVRAVLDSPHQFVPATSTGRVSGLIDREAVALVVARAALAQG